MREDLGQIGNQKLVFKLKQSGDQVSGTAGPGENAQSPIQDARLQGDHLTFSVTGPGESGAGSGPTWKFELTVSGERLDGRAEGTLKGQFLGKVKVVMSRRI